MHKRPAALTERGHYGTFHVHLTIQRHQQLHRFDRSIVCRHRSILVNVLVGQIFNGMTELFKRLASLGRELTMFKWCAVVAILEFPHSVHRHCR